MDSSLITRHPSLVTRHSSLVTRRLSLVTCHSSLKYLVAFAALLLLFSCTGKTKPATADSDSARIVPLEFCADSAMKFVEAQCNFGARTPGSAAHDQCAAYIADAFRAYGLSVSEQRMTLQGWDGKTFPCVNITAAYKPELQARVVIASHWDSRPWADNDADSAKHRQPVMAANDGASGVAVMLELARQISTLNPAVGVDFVCFDAEDYGAPYWGKQAEDGSDWCLGSRYWAQNLPEGYRPRYGVLLDMVGGADTFFSYEYYSRQYASDVMARLWSCALSDEAKSLFKSEDGTAVMDDHVPMNQIAHIPTVDVIGHTGQGFSSTWHTTTDIPQNISARHLKAVGQTLMQMLFEEN